MRAQVAQHLTSATRAMNAALERSAVDARAAHSVDLLRFERMLSALSARFISLPPADVSRAVDAALVDIARCMALTDDEWQRRVQ